MLRLVVRLAAVALGAAAAGFVVPPAAEAATCSTASGVSVVVDFHQLGDIQSGCDADGAGKYAAAQFTDVGHTLTYVQGQAFVCQVDGAPSTQCVRTPPATAYWSLWWSDGKSGTWTYASVGVGSLKVPAGGYVALSWQKGTAQAPPRVTPTSHSPSSPTSHPTSQPPSSPTHPTHGSTSGQGVPTSPPSGVPTARSTGAPEDSSAPASDAPTERPSGSPHETSPTTSETTQSAAAAVTDAAEPPDTSAPSSGSGLPGWVPPALVAALFVAAAAVAVVRRKRTGGA